MQSQVQAQCEVYTSSVVINEAPVPARKILTKGFIQDEISRQSGAAISTRGRFLHRNSPHPTPPSDNDRDKPLYLFIQAPTQQAVQLAIQKIHEIIHNNTGMSLKANSVGGPPSVPTHAMPPQCFSERLYVGLDGIPPSFGLKGKIIGQDGSNLAFIRSETGARVILCGGEGVGTEPLHLLLEHSSQEGLHSASLLAANLIETLAQEFHQAQCLEMNMNVPMHTNVPPPPLQSVPVPGGAALHSAPPVNMEHPPLPVQVTIPPPGMHIPHHVGPMVPPPGAGAPYIVQEAPISQMTPPQPVLMSNQPPQQAGPPSIPHQPSVRVQQPNMHNMPPQFNPSYTTPHAPMTLYQVNDSTPQGPLQSDQNLLDQGQSHDNIPAMVPFKQNVRGDTERGANVNVIPGFVSQQGDASYAHVPARDSSSEQNRKRRFQDVYREEERHTNKRFESSVNEYTATGAGASAGIPNNSPPTGKVREEAGGGEVQGSRSYAGGWAGQKGDPGGWDNWEQRERGNPPFQGMAQSTGGVPANSNRETHNEATSRHVEVRNQEVNKNIQQQANRNRNVAWQGQDNANNQGGQGKVPYYLLSPSNLPPHMVVQQGYSGGNHTQPGTVQLGVSNQQQSAVMMQAVPGATAGQPGGMMWTNIQQGVGGFANSPQQGVTSSNTNMQLGVNSMQLGVMLERGNIIHTNTVQQGLLSSSSVSVPTSTNAPVQLGLVPSNNMQVGVIPSNSNLQGMIQGMIAPGTMIPNSMQPVVAVANIIQQQQHGQVGSNLQQVQTSYSMYEQGGVVLQHNTQPVMAQRVHGNNNNIMYSNTGSATSGNSNGGQTMLTCTLPPPSVGQHVVVGHVPPHNTGQQQSYTLWTSNNQ